MDSPRNVFEPGTPYRAADHDPVLVGMFAPEADLQPSALGINDGENGILEIGDLDVVVETSWHNHGDAAADGAVVHVHLADRDRDALVEAELSCPRPAQTAGRDGGVMRFLIQPVARLGEPRVEQREKLLVGQAAPVFGVHRLVSGHADAADDLRGRFDAGEDGWNPVGEFDP